MKNSVTGKMITSIGRALVARIGALRRFVLHVERPVVDEDNSPVIVVQESNYGIYINTRVVHDVERTINRVIHALRKFEEESSHKFIHSIVRGRGGIFYGPYSGRAQHLVVVPRKGYSFASSTSTLHQ
ncbi:hypothetical protein [Hyperthermus butylicus]|uniref:Uncharacterized protein n=1 Tax=Hyperthermus butylicus (strain DSM 5456 / JCM 9403 / PLM1-5) TaxID=415426 RepID=A2BMW7_HYPBU|nr:hypothetical protein [Hyperthermus butylicus]ABM81328.1 hypothetical protein Hbut_1506 [Hyperthermus butylicus DSM 5456]